MWQSTSDVRKGLIVDLVWAYTRELENAAKYFNYTSELPALDFGSEEYLDQLNKKTHPLGITFDDYDKAKAKTELLNQSFNWTSPLVRTKQCVLCQKYFQSYNGSQCPRCEDISVPSWLDEAKLKCDLADNPVDAHAALIKAWQIMLDCGAVSDVFWIHNDSCEFKWPGVVALYTFANKDTIFLLERDAGFMSVTKEEFKIKFSG
jgi:hypothetical protein